MEKLSKIAQEFKEWKKPENKEYLKDYIVNPIKIILGKEPVNYSNVQHENKVLSANCFLYGVDNLTKNYVSSKIFSEPALLRKFNLWRF